MDFSRQIVELYSSVYESQKLEFNVTTSELKGAIKDIHDAYSPKCKWQTDSSNKQINFNNAAHRCAYLHKHAMVHSGLMCEILQAIFDHPGIYNELISKGKLKICSLGGGPGTEIVSLLLVLEQFFGSIPCSINVIDFSLEWKQVFDSIIWQLRTGRYGSVWNIVSKWYFTYWYFNADLLNLSHQNAYEVHMSIENADIITMIKFISAAACDKTKTMVKKIFQTMKPGGMLLFVDSAAGGYDKMVRDAALECGMVTVFGPLNHYVYENSSFGVKRHHCTSRSKTTVSVEMWRKPQYSPYNPPMQLLPEDMYSDKYFYNMPCYKTAQLRPQVLYSDDYLYNPQLCAAPQGRPHDVYLDEHLHNPLYYLFDEGNYPVPPPKKKFCNYYSEICLQQRTLAHFDINQKRTAATSVKKQKKRRKRKKQKKPVNSVKDLE